MTRGDLAIRHVDLRAGPEAADIGTEAAFVVFWWSVLPLGRRVYVPEQLPLSPEQVRQLTTDFLTEQHQARGLGRIRATYGARPLIVSTLGECGTASGFLAEMDMFSRAADASAEDLTVIVCTRDRPEALANCLKALAAQQAVPGEVVVVDNSASRSAEAVAARFPFVTFVHEPAPGLSVARNAGVRAARRPLIAFTDDDVAVEPGWTAEIVTAFTDPGVDAVTGLVLPASLDTPARRWFQLMMGGFGETYVPMLFERTFFEENKPYGVPVWTIGAGANMAFRHSVFERIGLFDERLGAGASGCSEDSELWYRLLAAGGTILYEPRAVVHHHHRADWPGLKQQIRAYMKGHASALVVQHRRFGDRGNLARMLGQLPKHYLSTVKAQLLAVDPAPRYAILWQEVLGWLAGMQYLFRRGWQARRGFPDLPPGGGVHG